MRIWPFKRRPVPPLDHVRAAPAYPRRSPQMAREAWMRHNSAGRWFRLAGSQHEGC